LPAIIADAAIHGPAAAAVFDTADMPCSFFRHQEPGASPPPVPALSERLLAAYRFPQVARSPAWRFFMLCFAAQQVCCLIASFEMFADDSAAASVDICC